MKLSLAVPVLYRVKRGQKLADVAAAFGIPARLIAERNRLAEEIEAGMVIGIPPREGNLYVVRGGESKSLLCGSPARFEEKNGTKCLFVGQCVLL